MSHKIAYVSLLAFALPLAACAFAPTEEASDGELTEEAASALQGGPWTWVNAATGRCLDSNGNGDAYALGCNGGSYQKWRNVSTGDGDTIINQATGRCLDSDGGGVYTRPCNGGRHQRWISTNKGGGVWEMRNVATGRCLDSNGSGDVYTRACNSGDFQLWD
ncbi:RICIN domain-containing protein [Sorangium sp. So ce1000]|uniref:RICIN domain-containing protein n=1 Tax=Sorangium sp. So ce1000 TaxID=3133325 RepID=UPI003F62EFCE